MKSVRRNAELTSFTPYTSAVAHIINITEKGYSSSLRQHMGERCGMQRGGEEDSTEGRYSSCRSWTARMGHVEYKFIYEMSSRLYDSQVNFTRNYCCVVLNAAS